MAVSIDPNNQIYTDGVMDWIKNNQPSSALFAKDIQHEFEKMPDANHTGIGEDNQNFFRVVISGKIFWVRADYVAGDLLVMLPEEYNKKLF